MAEEEDGDAFVPQYITGRFGRPQTTDADLELLRVEARDGELVLYAKVT